MSSFFAPFEFNITELVHVGENDLKIVLKNDFIYGGVCDFCGTGQRLEGDKLYAATGIGWDDPELGWHHCPPGFGICHKVFLEVKNETFIEDLFPRVNDNASEIWVDCYNSQIKSRKVSFDISIYGQNFEEKTAEFNKAIETSTLKEKIDVDFVNDLLIDIRKQQLKSII